ncbi:MAG TPA: DPP IV N-terminal domain-containing protein [Pyrinomonadaceae bacterium]|jgi:Tol biopolymer transport system component/DNA-binding winged helix-turn-helix (wHTH) protein
MSRRSKYFYEFGPFLLDAVNRSLLRDGELVPLKQKAVETLLLLVRHNGEVVGKDDLMNSLWPDSFVEEANLTQNIYLLRKALGDGRYIETVPRRGYRFAAEVKEWEETAPDLILFREKTSLSYEEEEEARDDAVVNEVRESAGAAAVRTVLPAKVGREASARGRRLGLPAAASIAALLVAAAALFFWPRSASPHFEKVRLTSFTTTGKAVKAAVSPDGKYLAYVVSESGQRSLWLRQVATGKELLIVPPAHVEFYGLTFSHDGNFIYYVSQEMNRLGMLFRVPSLGGEPNKLIEDVDSPVTLSPNGARLAFVRLSPTNRSIVVANADGTGERKLFSTDKTAPVRVGDTPLVPPAWSPDGRTIACPVAVTAPEGEYQTVWSFPAEGGREEPHALTGARWQAVGRMEWLADGSGLLATAAEQGMNAAQQIWLVAYPEGSARKVTNDLSDYRDLSLTKDGKTLIAVQSERKANVWLADAADTGHTRQLTSTNHDGLDGLAWSPGGKLVYTLQAGGEQNLWLTDTGGGEPKQLTTHAGVNRQPVVSPDGRYIVFVSDRTGQQHLWRIDADGKNPLELTRGAEDLSPDFTPDGRWVIYKSTGADTGYLFRVSVNGGEPVRVMTRMSGLPAVSPDGKLLAFFYRESAAATNKLAVMPLAGGDLRLISDLPEYYGRFRWTPDGHAIAYADKRSGTGNIWLQPLDARPPKQLTNWGSNSVFYFAWSRDAKWLAYATGAQTSDVVLIDDVGQ